VASFAVVHNWNFKPDRRCNREAAHACNDPRKRLLRRQAGNPMLALTFGCRMWSQKGAHSASESPPLSPVSCCKPGTEPNRGLQRAIPAPGTFCFSLIRARALVADRADSQRLFLSGFPLPDDIQVFCRAISSKSLSLSPIKIEYSRSGSFASRTKESQGWKLKHRTLFRKYSFT